MIVQLEIEFEVLDQQDIDLLIKLRREDLGQEHDDYNEQDLYDDWEAGYIRLFDSYKSLFYWIHQRYSKTMLISLLLEKVDYVDHYIQLSNGNVGYISDTGRN